MGLVPLPSDPGELVCVGVRVSLQVRLQRRSRGPRGMYISSYLTCISNVSNATLMLMQPVRQDTSEIL